ncbi:hypothetical protein CIPAW_11G198600 [Carya illinoinensis]|uniref:Uncharacterized protein n=1 Tax=Carya illinoinensis TaxID=32201 RepID=A0A8T1P672_CARIL|nr:hypothetical protein CIPAW_11G198600 [Carya illinoinensis]
MNRLKKINMIKFLLEVPTYRIFMTHELVLPSK